MIRTIVAVAISALWLADISPADAQSAARCPPGQIWRVSKKVCEPKAQNMQLFGGKAAKPKADAVRAEPAPVAVKPVVPKPATVEPEVVTSAKPEPAPMSRPDTIGVDREPVGTIRPRADAPDAPAPDAPAPEAAPPVTTLVPTPAPRPDDLAAPVASAPDVAVSVAAPPAEAVRPPRELPPIVHTGLYGDEQRVYRLVKAVTLPTEDLGHSLAPGEILADAVRLRPLPEGAERELSMFRDLRLQYVFANGAVALVLPASRMVLRVIAQEGGEQRAGGRD